MGEQLTQLVWGVARVAGIRAIPRLYVFFCCAFFKGYLNKSTAVNGWKSILISEYIGMYPNKVEYLIWNPKMIASKKASFSRYMLKFRSLFGLIDETLVSIGTGLASASNSCFRISNYSTTAEIGNRVPS